MLKRSLIIALFATPMLAGALRAQTWDAPMFYGPKPMDELGLYYFKSPFGSVDVNGLKAIWRQTGNINLGVQAGVGDLSDLGDAVMVGAELGNSLTGIGSRNGLAAAWSLGAGATFGHGYADLSVPLGVSIGLTLGSGNTTIVPFVHPRVSLDVSSFDNPATGKEETDTNIGLEADLGVEVGLGQRFLVRGGYSFGDRDAWGIGFALRTPRKVSVNGR